MQTIIKKFNDSLGQENLFNFWQNELMLRQQIRTAATEWEGVIIENTEEFNFVKRSLYYGDNKDEFFKILYRNMSSLTIINCVLESSGLAAEFLQFLAYYIYSQKPPARDIQFLINVYQEEFHSEFIEVINAMDDTLCAYLLARTTNNKLRELLKSRQIQITKESTRKHYGLVDSHRPNGEYPTVYGDKIQLLADAVKAFKTSQSYDLTSPLNYECIEALLDGADLLFRAGMLADCLAILADIVKHQGGDGEALILRSEEPYNKQITQLLRKALPFYGLLVKPTDPHRYTLELYRSLFPGFSPDPSSLLYLDIQTITAAGLQGYREYACYEIAQKAGRVLSCRPDDLPASFLHKSIENLEIEDIKALETAVAQRMPSMPHESYIIMEILRLWHKEEKIAFDRTLATQLLRYYLQFFNWMPCSLFMNEMLLHQLGPLADEETRNAGERVVSLMQEFSVENLPIDKKLGQKFTDPRNHKLQMQLLLSKYMGVF